MWQVGRAKTARMSSAFVEPHYLRWTRGHEMFEMFEMFAQIPRFWWTNRGFKNIQKRKSRIW
jgi:hypothetical protein